MLCLALLFCLPEPVYSQAKKWQSGVASMVITPQTDLWMAGYAARERPAEGILHELMVKALVLQDASGKKAVFLSSDLIGIPKSLSDAVSAEVSARFGFDRSQVMLTSSHTHSGPVFGQILSDIYPMGPEQVKQVNKYTRWLQDKMVEVISAAMANLEASNVAAGFGQARFAVNRRNNNEEDITKATELKGPVDHSVPVLRVTSSDGSLRAIVFGYACHATTLNGYHWSGDYPGFAQYELEKKYPGAMALFFAGCGGDQNPLPRRTVPLARQYGTQLSAAVTRTMEEEMIALEPVLNTTYNELELSFVAPPSKSELEMVADSDSRYQSQWAKRWLSVMESGEPIPKSYPWYPVQTWQLGSLSWIALGGEVVVDYAIALKKTLGQQLFITAYANDVMAYIPSIRVLQEGGYEGKTSMRAYGLPSSWHTDIEEIIITEVNDQVNALRTKNIKE